MELQFTVGQRPGYAVEFIHSKFWGRTRITVDGQTVFKQNLPFEESWSTVKRHHLSIDDHEVIIEIERKRAFAGLRPMEYRAFVDGELVQSRTG
ncbi:hypothetical protein GCM10009557_35760 [Virgisporangium ochraceum]|uniref:Uncharacterized protein n=1 Tax=Virgisporangium ochraceum TaxID=65505 RepID=A0A8J3ZWB2_9ACTN|nr:hypothetical protein [Virgisporangium ochraceum]GIJ70816.1 hypothetical protein Voc01_057330 [Virgisporangium ochraceum]